MLLKQIAPECTIENITEFIDFADTGVFDVNASAQLVKLGLVERSFTKTASGYQLSKLAKKIAVELGEFEKPYSGTILSEVDSRINVDELLKQIDGDF